MLAAQLRGKLTRKEEDLEDLLSSNVFGSIKYTPNEKGLIPLLSAAEDSNGLNPLKRLPNISDVTYEFWPYLNDGNGNAREPDVLIHITHETKQRTIIWHCPNLEYLMENKKIPPNSIDDLSNSQSLPVCPFSATDP